MTEREQKEPMNPTFEQVQKAFVAFQGDYGIVNHPDTPFANPFGAPNGRDRHGHRQYSITSIEGMAVEEILKQVAKAEILYVGCMDKDAARPGYEELKRQYPDKNIMTITMAGGIVQNEDRGEALGTILAFIGAKAENLQRAILSDHENRCGYVAYATDDALGKRGVEFGSPDEQREMKSLIINGVNAYKEHFREEVEVKPALLIIDRQTKTYKGGSAYFNYDFDGIEPQALQELL